jgi:hypothetical protein
MELVEALKMFNRKERYWLIRNALREKSEILDSKFLKLLNDELFIEVPKNAWWAMDYHLDWLVGALLLVNDKGERTAYKRLKNPRLFKGKKGKYVYLVNGSIEDVDLIIAFKETLIFIEAKGDADWDYERLKSKIDRLRKIVDKYEYNFIDLKTYFILMDTKAMPVNQMNNIIDAARPDWIITGNTLRRLDLRIKGEPDFESFCRVERCNENKPCKTGELFLVKNPQESKSDLQTKA